MTYYTRTYTYISYRLISDNQKCVFQCTIFYIIQRHVLALSVHTESKFLGELGEVRYCCLLHPEVHLRLL